MEKVSGSTSTVYIFSGSKVIAEYDNNVAPSSPSREYIYAGGTLLAKIDSSGTEYYHQDQLSNRVVTDSSGNTLAQMGHYPYGESWYNATKDKLLFTTYERDAESGNDYAMMRSYVSRLARMSSPDLLSGSIADPQSLNRYAYVANDPANSIDPSGLCNSAVAQDSGSGTSEGSGSGGPSATDFAGDLADPDPQFETWDCYWSPSGGGGSLWLDGTDITAYGGEPGFPIGGPGAIGDPIGNSGIVLQTHTGDEPSGSDVSSALLNPNGQLLQFSETITFFPDWLILLGDPGGGPVITDPSQTGPQQQRVGGNSGWAWTFTKTFVSNFFSPKFYKQELAEGGCLNTFLEGVDQADVLGPVLNGSPGFAETAIKGQAATLAARYAANQGLTVPLRSSVVRGILEKGETGAGAFAIGYFDVQAATGVFKETQAALAGTCH